MSRSASYRGVYTQLPSIVEWRRDESALQGGFVKVRGISATTARETAKANFRMILSERYFDLDKVPLCVTSAPPSNVTHWIKEMTGPSSLARRLHFCMEGILQAAEHGMASVIFCRTRKAAQESAEILRRTSLQVDQVELGRLDQFGTAASTSASPRSQRLTVNLKLNVVTITGDINSSERAEIFRMLKRPHTQGSASVVVATEALSVGAD